MWLDVVFYLQMRYIVETQGLPPDSLLAAGYKTGCFFERDFKSSTRLWKLKVPPLLCLSVLHLLWNSNVLLSLTPDGFKCSSFSHFNKYLVLSECLSKFTVLWMSLLTTTLSVQSPGQYYREAGIRETMETRLVKFSSLDGLLHVSFFF